jgi:hypothetical protein
MGPAARHLGLLALHLSRYDDAIGFLTQAAAMEEHAGLLPGLANTSALLSDALARRGHGHDRARAAEHRRRADALSRQLGLVLLVDRISLRTGAWSLLADDGDWMLVASGERARLRDGRGLHYLRALLAAPGREIAALDLVAGGAGLATPVAEPLLDDQARSAYQRRLVALEDELDAADRAGDSGRAARVDAERAALIAELRQATGLGGRARVTTDEAERARVNVTRTLRNTIERITTAAPRAGAHLGTSVRTGRFCCYQPAPGGPPGWRL